MGGVAAPFDRAASIPLVDSGRERENRKITTLDGHTEGIEDPFDNNLRIVSLFPYVPVSPSNEEI